jgi:hypothetical protein
MNAAKLIASAAAGSALAGTAAAQFNPAPTLPGGLPIGSPTTAPPPPNALGIAPQPAPPGGQTIWQRLGVGQEQREFCRRNMCRTPYGQLMSRIRAPFTRLSGGLIPPYCPGTPSLAELLDPGPIGAAAKVKQDRAGAEERIKAVKYLGTVDCHYWPEAEEALIGALRNDRNECVRYEAAVVLANGCCCTPKVIAALSHTVSCSSADGAPSETSPRVRAAAAIALERCLEKACGPMCGLIPEAAPVGQPVAPPVEERKEDRKEDRKEPTTRRPADSAPATAKAGPPRDPGEPVTMREYYTAVGRLPRERVAEFARKALDYGNRLGYTTGPEVNPSDYAAAGLPASTDARAVSNPPSNLWDILTHKAAPAIAQPMMVPGTRVYSTVPVMAETAPPAVAAAPVVVPTPMPAAPAKLAVTPPAAPAPVAAKPTPAPAPKAVPAVPVSRPTPAPIPVAPASKPTPAPAPIAVPAVSLPTVTTPVVSVPAVSVPTPVMAEPVPVDLPPVERLTPVAPPVPVSPTAAPARPAPRAGYAEPRPISAAWVGKGSGF